VGVYGLPFIHPFTKARRRDGAPKPAAQPAVHRPQIKEHSMSDKKEDLVGPGIGDYLVVREKEHSCAELAVGT
jgi:hypothetical protein